MATKKRFEKWREYPMFKDILKYNKEVKVMKREKQFPPHPNRQIVRCANKKCGIRFEGRKWYQITRSIVYCDKCWGKYQRKGLKLL